jgi:hypothetical protein
VFWRSQLGYDEDTGPWWIEGIEVIVERHPLYAGKMGLITKVQKGSHYCSVLLYTKHRDSEENANHV